MSKLEKFQADLERSRLRLAEIRDNFANISQHELRKDPGIDKPEFLKRQNLLIDTGKIHDAEVECQEIATKYPDRPEGKIGLARVAMRSHQYSLALERWQAVIEQFPEQIEAYVGKGKALIELGRIDEAKTLFQQLADKHPDNPHGLIELATVHQIYKDWETALTYWEKCAVKWPDIFWIQAGKANALMQLRKFAEAETIFKQLETQYPEQPQGIEGLTRLARILGNLELSLQYAEQLIARFPHLPTGYWEKQQALIELGRFAEANQAFLSRPSFPQGNIIKRKTPVGFPPDLVLPEMVGVNNDYTFLEEKLKDFVASGQEYTLPVSIIIPVYNRKAILAKTLAAICHQTYPKNLIEVVVVDDGSSDGVEEVIRKYENYFELIYTRQADRGYRLSAARNLGMRSAKYEHFISLDCDVLPPHNFVENYMKWFHVTDRAILIGFIRYVCTDALTDDDILKDVNLALELPDIIPENQVTTKVTATGKTYNYLLALYSRTNAFKEMSWVQGFGGGNVAYPRQAIETVGEFDESFNHWGCEDTEIAYRFYNAGYYFIPVISAIGLHQEPPGGKNETDRSAGREVTIKQLEEKCCFPMIRKYEQGRTYQTPKVSIFMPAYNAEKYIKDAVDSVLNQTYTDLEVCICNDGSTDKTLQILESNYTNNDRVRWISQANGGVSKASNAAVKMCRGMYIGQLDSDDLLKPDAVKLFVDYLDRHPDVGFVYGSYEIIDREGQFIRECHPGVEFSREALLMGMIVSPFRMFRKRDYMRTTGFDEGLSINDYDICLKLSQFCYFHHLDAITYSHRWHGDNASIKKFQQVNIESLILINIALKRLGLSSEWIATQADINQPRSVKLCRKTALLEFNSKNKLPDDRTQEKTMLMKQKLAADFLDQGKIQEAIDEYSQALHLPGEEKATLDRGLAISDRKIELEKAIAYGKSDYVEVKPIPTKPKNYLNLEGKNLIDSDPQNHSRFYRNFILDKCQAIYFKLPKCACSSILIACADLIDLKIDKSDIHSRKIPSASFEEVVTKYNHYLKFTFVRNPWDRVVSCYREKIADPHPNKFPNSVTECLSKLNVYRSGMSFDEFVKVISEIPDDKAEPHFRSQYTFLIDHHNNFFIDYVGRFENLDEEFRYLCELIFGKTVKLENHNKSCFLPDRKYQDFYTDETQKIIAKRYAVDINLFGYSFN